jgi:hypothetical protein
MTTLDLAGITKKNVSLLAGQVRGVDARAKLGLDKLDTVDQTVKVLVPSYITAITTSFVQGLFAGSQKMFKSKDDVIRHYDISALPEGLRRDIYSGLDRLYVNRELP